MTDTRSIKVSVDQERLAALVQGLVEQVARGELDSEEARDEALRLARSEADELIHIKTRLLGVIPGGKQENSMETFTCEMCGGTFEKGCSDDEANAEAKANFGVDNASTHEGMATVCDPCYEKLMGPA